MGSFLLADYAVDGLRLWCCRVDFQSVIGKLDSVLVVSWVFMLLNLCVICFPVSNHVIGAYHVGLLQHVKPQVIAASPPTWHALYPHRCLARSAKSKSEYSSKLHQVPILGPQGYDPRALVVGLVVCWLDGCMEKVYSLFPCAMQLSNGFAAVDEPRKKVVLTGENGG